MPIGAPGLGLESPLALIACAGRHGLTLALEEACIEAALRHFHALRLEGRLFSWAEIRPASILRSIALPADSMESTVTATAAASRSSASP